MFDWKSIFDKGIDFSAAYAPRLISGIIVLFIGFFIAKLITKLVVRTVRKSKVDIGLEKFIADIVSVLLKVLVIITAASMLGVKMTSFIAILSAMAFAVGLALQGSLGNFAGGVLIIIFKPFKVGDLIEAQGYKGVVEGIKIFSTILKTPDNRTVVIPNGALSNNSIMNYSSEPLRRVDFLFGISYDSDFRKAKEIIFDIIKEDKRILKNPEPFAKVGELGDSSVNIVVRVWTDLDDYWGVHFDLIEKVKLKFDEQNIDIPYPHVKVVK